MFSWKRKSVEVEILERDIEEAEVLDWIEHFIWEITQAETVDDIDNDQFEVWGRLSDFQKGVAFYYLIGTFADLVGSNVD